MFGVRRATLARDLEAALARGESPASAGRRAEALFRTIYREALSAEQARILLPGSVRAEALAHVHSLYAFDVPVRIREVQQSQADGSVKFVLESVADGLAVESVLIPERGRLTQCLSTQVGCAQACRFCQTGRMGLARNLTAAEIMGQVMAVRAWRAAHAETVGPVLGDPRSAPLTNVVFMGMGEPLDNLDALLDVIDLLVDPKGLGLSPNKVTVSTVGLLPALERFLRESGVCLALSLHSPFDAERSKVMPVNVRHPVADVLAVLREHAAAYGRRFMFQYTLIRNVNDSEAHADALASLLEGLPAKVNLIPLNEHGGTAYRRPGVGSVYEFQSRLKARGLVATVRLSKGRDVQAACGQLIEESRLRPQRAERTTLAAMESPTL